MLKYFLELLGKEESKPFECIGTISEVTFAVNSIIRKSSELPFLLKYYKENYIVSEPNYEMISSINEENNVSEHLMTLIKGELNND